MISLSLRRLLSLLRLEMLRWCIGLSRIFDVFIRFVAEPPLAESVADRSDLAEPERFLLRLVRCI